MSELWDFSEIEESAELVSDLLAVPRSKPALPAKQPAIDTPRPVAPVAAAEPVAPVAAAEPVAPVAAAEPVGAVVQEIAPEETAPHELDPGGYRADHLESTIADMCRRGQFQGAVIADHHGLPLAVHNSPVSSDLIAAFTTVLGATLDKARSLLDEHNANHLSLDINEVDKAVLRQFQVDDKVCHLMIICPHDVDGRRELDRTTRYLGDILTSELDSTKPRS